MPYSGLGCKGPERIFYWGRGDEAAEDVLRDE